MHTHKHTHRRRRRHHHCNNHTHTPKQKLTTTTTTATAIFFPSAHCSLIYRPTSRLIYMLTVPCHITPTGAGEDSVHRTVAESARVPKGADGFRAAAAARRLAAASPRPARRGWWGAWKAGMHRLVRQARPMSVVAQLHSRFTADSQPSTETRKHSRHSAPRPAGGLSSGAASLACSCCCGVLLELPPPPRSPFLVSAGASLVPSAPPPLTIHRCSMRSPVPRICTNHRHENAIGIMPTSSVRRMGGTGDLVKPIVQEPPR